MADSTQQTKDNKFESSIQRTIGTVQAWDDDPLLLAEVRALIPWDDLRPESGPYAEPRDAMLTSPNARFLQRLTRYFQKSMTWVNSPPCSSCGSTDTMQHTSTRGPESSDEREGQASPVELHECRECNVTTPFARYNSTRKLLYERQGRCGEYANLFGLYCRAVGCETRYVWDATDHVWVEALIDGHWIMADGCEGVINEPSMYESGWGKKLSYAVAVGHNSVVDVTPRYTRHFFDDDFQARRRGITSSEVVGQRILQQYNQRLQSGMPQKAKDELNRRLKEEEKQLALYKQQTKWDKDRYGFGRISGSLAWKSSRQEDGTNSPKHEVDTFDDSCSHAQFHVESFYPRTDKVVSISLQPSPKSRHEAIMVSGAPCAVGEPMSLSVVILDEAFIGCVLQSRSFSSFSDLAAFVDSLPKFRIVAICGQLEGSDDDSAPKLDDGSRNKLARLGHFDAANVTSGVLFVGQVDAKPDWAYCSTYGDAPAEGVSIEFSSKPLALKELKLRTERNTRPTAVVGRLPETTMRVTDQTTCTEAQKRTAALSMLQSDSGSWPYSGYSSKPGAPVYLLGESAYPFEKVDSQDYAWTSYLLLPPPLVPDEDNGIVPSEESPDIEVPVDSTFFVQLLGPSLLKRQSGTPEPEETAMALRGSQLVALYFSAHWCGPCRSFTPMLAEFYQHLKDEVPVNGLEIVFVSSDRTTDAFHQYSGSMPWLSMPFENVSSGRGQALGARYGVRGIPSLVVLDAMSGQVVVDANTSRSEVGQACSRGETAIVDLWLRWLERVPAETKETLSMLRLSSQEHATAKVEEPPANPYLIRDEAARSDNDEAPLEPGPLNGKASRVDGKREHVESPAEQVMERMLSESSSAAANVQSVLSTALKYLTNAREKPWTPKFRSFKLSNKVADRITSVEGGLSLLCALGFYVTAPSQDDFVATIPLAADLDQMHSQMTDLLEKVQR